MTTNLSVNINKVATLRNARGENNPDVCKVAVDCQEFGADGITVHPRPDERHIRRADVYALRPIVRKEFNIEGYPDEEFMKLVLAVKPEQATLVPDAPGVLTSSAGWDVTGNFDFLQGIAERLRDAGIRTSIFVAPDAVQIAELNYLDTIELAYSGAQIIHPKTIKPLQNKHIPLYVRPFGDKRKPGTVIRGMSAPVQVPILILKKDQVLLTIRSRDFSFVLEEKFSAIFSLLERFRLKANLIHNSAVNLSLCVDETWHIDEAVEALRTAGFDVMKTDRMELLTIRGYTTELWEKYARGPQVFIRQSTQSTVRIVRKRG